MKGAALALVLCGVVIGGCTRQVSPDSYSASSVGQVNRSVRGTVISARPVTIDGTNALGATSGAGAGAVGGSYIGGDVRANALGAIGGAIAGGIAGAAMEESATRQDGREYVIETANGALITVVQGASPSIKTGDAVIVLYGARARIIPDPSAMSRIAR